MAHASETNGVNGEASAAWKPSNEDPSAFSEAHEGKKLSNAEMKKLQKQEKAARRAKEKESKAPDQSKASPASSSNARQPSKQDDGRPQQKDNVPQPSRQQGHSQQRKRRESTAAQPQATGNLPLRESSGATKKAPKAVPFFAHTYNTTRRRAPESTPKDVHAEISTLALHLSTYVICGSHARGVATLLAFKSVMHPPIFG